MPVRPRWHHPEGEASQTQTNGFESYVRTTISYITGGVHHPIWRAGFSQRTASSKPLCNNPLAFSRLAKGRDIASER